jgi:preprotein translocase subunit SecG
MDNQDYNHLYKITMKAVVFCIISICLVAYVKHSAQPPEVIEDISKILPKIIIVVIPLELIGWILLKNFRANT